MRNYKLGQVVNVDVNKLKPAPFDPEIRRSDKYTEGLLHSMKTYGYWPDKPITITKDYVIADGHRRWTVAKKLGVKKVPCIITNLDLEVAWAQGMATTRPISSRETFQAYDKGLREIPKNSTGNILKGIVNFFDAGGQGEGDKMVGYLTSHGLATSPVNYAKRTCQYLGWEASVENVKKVTIWIVENKLTRQILYMISETPLQVGREILANCINRNELPKFQEPQPA